MKSPEVRIAGDNLIIMCNNDIVYTKSKYTLALSRVDFWKIYTYKSTLPIPPPFVHPPIVYLQ